MKYFIKRNPNTTTGYEFVTEHDDGQTTTQPITGKALEKKTGITWLRLPENGIGRKLCNQALVNEVYELTPAKTRTTSTGESPSPKKSLIEMGNYLTDKEDKAKWQELCKKIEHAQIVAKAQAEYERCKAAYEALLNGGNK